jgi:RND family efflux transporter MFP subunit
MFLTATVLVGQAPKAPAGPVPVVVGKVVRQSYADQQVFIGSVVAMQQVIVGTAVEGRVAEMLVNRGDRVAGKPADSVADNTDKDVASPGMGQPIAILETQTLDIQIDLAEIQLDLIEQAAKELQASLPQEIEMAQARVLENQSRLELSRKELDRITRLADQAGAVAELEKDQARSQFEVDQQLAVQSAAESRQLEATRDLRIRQAELRVATARQELIRLEDLKSKYTIRAPFNGFVVNKFSDVGAWVQAGAPIAEIVQLDILDFIFNVPQDFLGKIQSTFSDDTPDLEVQVSVDGIETPFEGTVIAIVPQADLRSRMLPIRARIENIQLAGQPLLKPGLIGRASMRIGNLREMLLVQKDALVLGGIEPVVYKIIKNEGEVSASPVPVSIGMSVGSWIEVSGDITERDQVVIQGNERLRPGQPLSISETSDESPPVNR